MTKITSKNTARFHSGTLIKKETFLIKTSPVATTIQLTGQLPIGITFGDNHDGTAILSGIAHDKTTITYNVVIVADDGTTTDTQNLEIQVVVIPVFPIGQPPTTPPGGSPPGPPGKPPIPKPPGNGGPGGAPVAGGGGGSNITGAGGGGGEEEGMGLAVEEQIRITEVYQRGPITKAVKEVIMIAQDFTYVLLGLRSVKFQK